jgi:CubicO group peptidase (beta-lactamase class C family)
MRPGFRPFLLASALSLAGCGSSSPAHPASTAPDFGAMEKILFDGSWKSDGVVVLYDGEVVYEKYANGYTATTPHITYSVSKSVGGSLVGIALDEKLLQLEGSVCDHIQVPAGADPTLCDTTIEDLLHMSSGLAWSEDYGSDPTTSDVLQMLYGDQTDMGAYVASRPRAHPTGTVLSYSSGDANLLALALKGALGGQDMQAWAKAKLFGPAGLSSAAFEADRSGTLVFSSSCFLTPRDLAALGQLYLTGGTSGGARVLPEGWAAYATTAAPAASTPTPRTPDAGPGNSGGSYGAQIWLNAVTKDAPPDTFLYPEAPGDTYSFEGHWGQKVMIVPSRKLVIARVGNDRDVQFDPGPMVGAAVASIDAISGGG